MKTILYNDHYTLGAQFGDFVGFQMPLYYAGGIAAEHRATRAAAGLFDVSHLGAVEARGPGALALLMAALASDVERLRPGQAQYSYMLRPEGVAIDDLYLYCLDPARYMIVFNASNAPTAYAWLRDVALGKARADISLPPGGFDAEVIDLKNAGPGSRVGLAVQGPMSRKVLDAVVSPASREALGALRFNTVARLRLDGIDAWVSGTGFTGERTAFELFAHPHDIEGLWRAMLDAGAPLGATPCGLGARDSLRVEAGLPLFGHELEGPGGLTIHDIGYGHIVRDGGAPFIGQRAYCDRLAAHPRRLLRLRGQGRKSLRPGHAILDDTGQAVGEVTSFTFTDEAFGFSVLAAVQQRFDPPPGAAVRGVRAPAARYTPPPDPRHLVPLTAQPRHPDKAERIAWHRFYRERSPQRAATIETPSAGPA